MLGLVRGSLWPKIAVCWCSNTLKHSTYESGEHWRQECGLYFYLSGADNKLTDLRPEKLVDQGPRDLGQYIVEGWRIAAAREEYTGKKVVRVTMTLSREGRIISFSSQQISSVKS